MAVIGHGRAVKFARGHRGLRVPDPVIVAGRLQKRDVLCAINDRDEFEVVGNWANIKNLRIKDAKADVVKHIKVQKIGSAH